MKDAIVAEHSVVDAEQIVSQLIPENTKPVVLRDENGRLLPGSNLNPEGPKIIKGRARITERTMTLLNKSVADINYGISRGQFEAMSGAEAIAYKRAHAAIYGGIDDVNFIVDRDEGAVSKKTELTGKDGGPLAVATIDATSLLLELSERSEK